MDIIKGRCVMYVDMGVNGEMLALPKNNEKTGGEDYFPAGIRE